MRSDARMDMEILEVRGGGKVRRVRCSIVRGLVGWKRRVSAGRWQGGYDEDM